VSHGLLDLVLLQQRLEARVVAEGVEHRIDAEPTRRQVERDLEQGLQKFEQKGARHRFAAFGLRLRLQMRMRMLRYRSPSDRQSQNGRIRLHIQLALSTGVGRVETRHPARNRSTAF
jgi:hypothetical protein